jgi:hypothetical protein
MTTTTTTRGHALAEAAARALGLPLSALRGPERDAATTRARQLAALALLECGESTVSAGRELDRDHTTIMYHRRSADMGTRAEALALARRIAPDRPPPLEVLLREALATADRLEAQARELRRLAAEGVQDGA